MNISKIFNRIETQVEKHRLNKKITEINNYEKIHDFNTYGDSFNQMYIARCKQAPNKKHLHQDRKSTRLNSSHPSSSRMPSSA